MRNMVKFFGIITFAAVIWFSITGCEDLTDFFNDDVTFSLDKIDSRSFTLTVKNANWRELYKDSYENFYSYGFDNDFQLTDTIWRHV
ncbi:MAG: hypothetical protein FWC06_01965 [Treponema sp.]|nr:hypothetical protein [Treponema sp.]